MIEIVNRRANLSIRGVSDAVKIYEEEEEEEEEEEIGARCTQAVRFPAASWVYYAARAALPRLESGQAHGFRWENTWIKRADTQKGIRRIESDEFRVPRNPALQPGQLIKGPGCC